MREVLDMLEKKHEHQTESYKDVLIDATEEAQITRLTGENIFCRALINTYTHSELIQCILKYFTWAMKSVTITKVYGVPKRTLTLRSAKVLQLMGVKLLRDAQLKVRKKWVIHKKLKYISHGLLRKKKK